MEVARSCTFCTPARSDESRPELVLPLVLHSSNPRLPNGRKSWTHCRQPLPYRMMEELAVNHPQSAERANGPYNSHTRISGASANLSEYRYWSGYSFAFEPVIDPLTRGGVGQ